MPTKAEWEGMGRKVDMAEGDYIRKTPAGQLIAKEAFNEAIEAAAGKIELLGKAMVEIETKWGNYAAADAINAAVETLAAAIRKLKKP